MCLSPPDTRRFISNLGNSDKSDKLKVELLESGQVFCYQCTLPSTLLQDQPNEIKRVILRTWFRGRKDTVTCDSKASCGLFHVFHVYQLDFSPGDGLRAIVGIKECDHDQYSKDKMDAVWCSPTGLAYLDGIRAINQSGGVLQVYRCPFSVNSCLYIC